MAGVIYSLCALAAALCSHLLLSAHRRKHIRLLLWSGLCFAGLTLNNVLLMLDKVVFPEVPLAVPRTALALLAMTVLLYGLISEKD